MRLVICVSALPALARAANANVEDAAWPWDQDKKHAKPHNHFHSNMMATHSRVASHDFGSSWDASSSLDDSTTTGSSGDFMDQYITETGSKPLQIDDAKPQPKHDDSIPDMASLFNDDSKPAPKSSFDSDSHSDSTSAFASDMTNMFGASSRFDAPAPAPAAPVVDSSSSSDSESGWPWSGHNKKRNDMDTDVAVSQPAAASNSIADGASSNSASDSFSKMFSSWSSNDASSSASTSSGSDVSMPAHAPQQQDSMDNSRPADSPIEGPPQRESSIAGASATDQVVDVRLSSELQQSLLQARKGGTNMFSHFRGSN